MKDIGQIEGLENSNTTVFELPLSIEFLPVSTNYYEDLVDLIFC